MGKNEVSAVVITLNEEKNISRSLGGLQWVDEIIVADTGSTDNTIEEARRYTDKIYSIPWEGFGDAYNRATAFAEKEWIFFIHADEEMTPELEDEITSLLSNGNILSDGYYIARRPNFLGYWIKHSGWYPSYEMRLFRKNKGKCNDRIVHQDVDIDGKKDYLKNHLNHYTDPTMEIYLDKMNRFTTMASQELYDKNRKCYVLDLLFRPPAVFFKMFITKAGFLDGFPGFLAALFSSLHVFVKYLKLRRLWKDNPGDS
ncbi:MAG: glycosyltransferase family 2 protein [candidate division Zixibacteria bacterium]|nr:glycosyltransferase family 2 protein [candidate division Zixibacteria bacterium]